MRGILADVNVGGLLPKLQHSLQSQDLWQILSELKVMLFNFADLPDLPQDIDDRQLWNRCQQEQLALLTDNRNHDGPDSLEAVLRDSWRPVQHLPVLTLANKQRFEHDTEYARQIANDIAEIAFGINEERQFHQISRIWLPLNYPKS